MNLFSTRLDNYVYQQPLNNNNNKWKMEKNKYYTDFHIWISKQKKSNYSQYLKYGKTKLST